uniref:Uncharacterized protein n=1 Tax=Panagrolaimus sp. JU765 TaxID=591449 RepID=A0AC34RE30_9BILA
MNIRPAVHTWNRGELEDKFYRQYDQLLVLKKKNNELERRLRLTSTKIRQSLQNDDHSEADERCRELERENHLLIQKLKALRHQLINYTRPQSHNTTLNFLTSRTTARPQSSVEERTKSLHEKENNGYYSDITEVVNQTTHHVETNVDASKNPKIKK